MNLAFRARLSVVPLVLSAWLSGGAAGCGGGTYGPLPAGPPASAAAAPMEQAMPAAEAMSDSKESTAESKSGGGKKEKSDAPTTWKRSQIVPNSSRLLIGEREELPLEAMQAKVQIDGFRARVLIDYVYANDRGGSYEGTFQLRLPQEASPYFFAFGENTFEAPGGSGRPALFLAADVEKMGTEPLQIMRDRTADWVRPKEARMVPREKAAFAYQEVVRRRVDPALMEWAGAGVFSARVFPLAPGRRHRIVVGYDLDLVRIGNDLEYRFDLPEKIPPTAIDVNVFAGGNVEVLSVPPVSGNAYGPTRHFRFEDPHAHSIAIRLRGANAQMLSGHDGETGDYFAAQVQPSLPTTAASDKADAAVFMVDTSLSSNPDRFNIWLKLLRALLDGNRDSLKRFAVMFFSVDTNWYRPTFIDNTKENADALLRYADTLALEGATDLGAALAEAVRPAWITSAGRAQSSHTQSGYDLFLLSDGAATWGEANLHALNRTLASGRAGRLFAYQTGLAGTDVDALGRLARETGGGVFSVTGESEIAKAAVAHRMEGFRLVDAKVTGGSDVLLAGRPRALFAGQTLTVAGRGTPAPDAELLLVVERRGARQTLRTKLGSAIRSPLAPRVYGQIATAQLEELETATETTAKAYATHFRITGRTCSLLMLESEQDYARFGIRPDENALSVRTVPAGELFNKTLKTAYETLGDPKASFLSMIDKLKKSPGVRFEPPASYSQALTQMPASAFAVEGGALMTRMRERKDLSPPVADQLARHALEYDVISNDATSRAKQYGPGDGLKALSSLVEESPGDAVLARDVGFSAMDLGLRSQAYHLFRRVADMRPYEPQTYRAIAQALAAMGKNDLALAYYEIPLIGEWDQRFGDLRAIVELDYLRFLHRVADGQAKVSVPDYAKARLESINQRVGIDRADLVVAIMWNTDNTDVDLHVVEPSGEECYYGNRSTRSGGKLTRDVTQGYGPEMYVLEKASRGRYQIRAHYYASDRNRASARTKVYVTIIEDWGTPKEHVTEKVVALEYGKDSHEIATVLR